MIDQIQPLYLLLVSTALLAGAASVSIARFQKKARDAAAFWNSPTGAAVQADAGHGEHAENELAEQIAGLREAIEALVRERAAQTAAPSATPKMDNAILLAKQGASVTDLVQCCGLNVGEAKLLLRLHGSRAALGDAA